MIKKLRKKFILIALSVVATVILSIVIGLDVANYVNMTRDADEIITGLETGEVKLPPDAFEQGDLIIGERPDMQNGPKGLPRETAFSARYFTIEIDSDGNMTSDLTRIAYVQTSELQSFVKSAKGSSGFVGDFRYHKVTTDSGTKYVFLDCEKEIESCRDFIVSSAIITVVGLLVIGALIVLLSKKALRPVEESYEKQKRFITDAGHELKTPLTVISANAELLELDVGENEWIDSIKGQVKKLGKLTKELVFLSRMDEGSDNFPTAPFSLTAALEDTVEGLKEAAVVAGRSFTVQTEDVTVTANEEMIRRAIGLILDNAVKYAESDVIEVTLRKEGKYAVLEERNAASLEKGDHPELFERFYRPDTSRTAATGGHGIGLSVVRSIVEAHKGNVSCLSDGEIIVFKLALPL